MQIRYTIFTKFKLFIKISTLLLLSLSDNAYSSEDIKKNISISSSNSVIKENIVKIVSNDYILGPGDLLLITFEGLDNFSKEYIIDP